MAQGLLGNAVLAAYVLGQFSLVRLLGPPWFGLPTLQIQRSYALENLNVTIVNALFYCGSYFLRDYYSIY